MSRVKIRYRAGAATYRPRMVELSGKRPNFLVNNKDQQVHIINGKVVFPRAEPIRLNGWKHLLSQERPVPPRYVEGRTVFIEDNCFWPIDIRPFSSYAQKANDYSSCRENRLFGRAYGGNLQGEFELQIDGDEDTT